MTIRFALFSASSLAAGVNDTVDNAIELAELLHKWGPGYHVNLIPFNPIEGSEYQRPYKKSVRCFRVNHWNPLTLPLLTIVTITQIVAFSAALESHKITVSVRQTRGLDASAACGQLRNEFQKKPLLAGAEVEEPELEIAVAAWCLGRLLCTRLCSCMFRFMHVCTLKGCNVGEAGSKCTSVCEAPMNQSAESWLRSGLVSLGELSVCKWMAHGS